MLGFQTFSTVPFGRIARSVLMGVCVLPVLALAGPSPLSSGSSVNPARAASLRGIWQANAGRTVELNEFNTTDSQGRITQTTSLKFGLKFPDDGVPGRLQLAAEFGTQALFESDVPRVLTLEMHGRDLVMTAEDNRADVRVTINVYGNLRIEFWEGPGTTAERHGMRNTQHAYSVSEEYLLGSTLTKAADLRWSQQAVVNRSGRVSSCEQALSWR